MLQVNSKAVGLLLAMNFLVLGLFLGQFLTTPTAIGQEEEESESGQTVDEAKALDRLPPQMVYYRLDVPKSDDPKDGRVPGLFLYDTVNQTMRLYAFNNLETKGSRGDIELLAVRDVQFDALLLDTGLTTRGDDAKRLGGNLVYAQGMRPRDIFEMLKKAKIVDKHGNVSRENRIK